jgi:ethanolamine utilization protein EutA
VGGRLLATDSSSKIVRIEDAAIAFADQLGLNLHLGGTITDDQLHRLVDLMTDTIVAAISPSSSSNSLNIPYLTDPIGDLTGVDGVIFSGGVGEYVYETETRDFGDLGIHLGKAIRSRIKTGAIPFKLLPATARMRATALGASEFSIQLSGNTCYIADAEKLLPARNLQVIKPIYSLDHQIDVEKVAAAIATRVDSFANPDLINEVVLAMHWTGELSYNRLHDLALAIVKGLEVRIKAGKSILLAFDADMGKALGSMLRDEFKLGVNILVVDGLNLLDFDYIDLGHPLQPSLAIPVTIKSLVF